MDLRCPAPSHPGGPKQWLRWRMPESYPHTVAGPCRNFTGFPILPEVSLVKNRGTARYSVSKEKLTRPMSRVKGHWAFGHCLKWKPVIPAKAGIQRTLAAHDFLDTGLRRCDGAVVLFVLAVPAPRSG